MSKVALFNRVKGWLSPSRRNAQLQDRLNELRQRVPAPVFWLIGKTQSGKTTLIKYLTGANDAEIGQGFQPCTRFSRQYDFPTAEARLLTFLDTRGLEEPGYDPQEDLDRFKDQAHLVVATVKVMDHAQEKVLMTLRAIRKAQPQRPIILVATCLHEAYPQQQHPDPYPYHEDLENASTPEALYRSLKEQRQRFDGLVDRVVAVDLTPPEEGFQDPYYGGAQLKKALLDALPAAYRQTLLTLDEVNHSLRDLFAQHALPHIIGYSTLAATAGAIPVPWLDLLILPGIQTRMIYHLAQVYGQPLSAHRFAELASTLGLGMFVRQLTREVVKFIPFVGVVASSTLAAASTFALGKAFCFYYSAVHQGHVPQTEDLRRYYKEQLALAEQAWRNLEPAQPTPKLDGSARTNS